MRPATVAVFKGNPTWPSKLSQLRENNPFKSASLRACRHISGLPDVPIAA
jgi:hypothetical protein